MRIGIISNCNVNYLKRYLDSPYDKEIYIGNDAPSVTNIIEGLIQQNCHVVVFKLYNTTTIKTLYGRKLNIVLIPRCNKYPWKYLIDTFWNTRQLIKAINQDPSQLDCLHAHWSYETILAALPWKNKIPVFCSVRDWTPYIFKIESFKNKISWIQRIIIFEYIFRQKNITFISNSPYTQNLIKRKISIETPIIPNSVKDSFLTPDRTFYPDKPIIASIISSNDKRKNCKTLLYAFQKLLLIEPNAKLILIGEPFASNNPEIKKLEGEGLLQNVILKGLINQTEIKEILLTSSMLVHPALEETFGNTLIEAMATKLPVIGGKNSGAVPYVLEDGECGILCNVKSDTEILNSILLLQDSTIRNSLVNKAFLRVKTHFSQEAVTMQHLNLYNKINKSATFNLKRKK